MKKAYNAIGFVCFFVGLLCFLCIDGEVGIRHNIEFKTYGGDAYTDIQNAVAATVSNINNTNEAIGKLLEAIRLVSSMGFFVVGMFAFAKAGTLDVKSANQNNTNNPTPLNTLNYNNNSNSTRKVPVTMERCYKCGGYYDVGSKECPYCGNKSKQHQEDNSANKYQQSNDNKLSYSNFVSRMRCPECGEYHDINCTECPKCGHKY